MRQGSKTLVSRSCSAFLCGVPSPVTGPDGEAEAQRGPDLPWSHSPLHKPRPPDTQPPAPLLSWRLPRSRLSPTLSGCEQPGLGVRGRLEMCSPPLGQSWPAPHPAPGLSQPAGCHPFSVHLICLQTMKKNRPHLSVSATAMIDGLHQTPYPKGTLLLPQTPQGRRSRVGMLLTQLPGSIFRDHSAPSLPALSLWRDNITNLCCAGSGNACDLSA